MPATKTLSPPADTTDRPAAREQEQASPEGTKRAVLTLLILFHLFTLFVAVAANPPTSELLFRLKRVPVVREYLELLGMDLSYRFHLSYGAFIDNAWEVEAVLTMPDDTQQTVTFPDPEMPNFRRQHYHPLLMRWATTPDEGIQGMLAQRVARRLMEETGAKSATVSLRAQVPLNPEQVKQSVAPDAESQFTTLYSARAWYDINGAPQFMKTAGGAESAPAPTENPAQ